MPSHETVAHIPARCRKGEVKNRSSRGACYSRQAGKVQGVCLITLAGAKRLVVSEGLADGCQNPGGSRRTHGGVGRGRPSRGRVTGGWVWAFNSYIKAVDDTAPDLLVSPCSTPVEVQMFGR